MTQTKIFVSIDSGLNFDIDPKVIINPKGIAIKSVNAKTRQFSKKPINSSLVIISKLI